MVSAFGSAQAEMSASAREQVGAVGEPARATPVEVARTGAEETGVDHVGIERRLRDLPGTTIG